ncbi:MAG: SGNH/GDSL hydrolase family protein [Ferruginibacter sp.]
MKKLLVIVTLFISAISYAQKSPQPFKAGDKIVFVGNSITEAGFYEMYIWQYYMLHFPGRKITVYNGGIGGDVAGNILARLDEDILVKKPTVLVLTFGMNDSRYFEYFNTAEEKVRKEAVATSYESYLGIEKKLQAVPDMQKIIMTSSPYDETMTGPKNNFHGKYKTMQEIARFQREAAAKNKWAFVDLMEPMDAIDVREQQKDTNFTMTGPDRIHPGSAGHFAMAWLFLKAQGLAKSVVADININAATGKLAKGINCVVTNIKSTQGKLSFDYKAKSLPFPIDSVARVWENSQKQSDALAVIPFTEEFNKEMLAVTGLKKGGNYELSIDGETIGQWNGSQLSKGVNLAVLGNTPQYNQAKQVADLNLQYHDLEKKFRSYYWLQFNYFKKKGMMFQDTEAALDSVNADAAKDWGVAFQKDNYQQARKKEVRDNWEKEMLALKEKMYMISQPVKHSMIITLVK